MEIKENNLKYLMQKGEICYNKTETGHEADDGKSARPQNGNGTKKLTVYLL